MRARVRGVPSPIVLSAGRSVAIPGRLDGAGLIVTPTVWMSGPDSRSDLHQHDGTRRDIINTDMSDSVPFQVQLTRGQHRRLKRLAESRGVSMGSILRESVADYLTSTPVEEDPAFGIIGLINDDGPTPHGDPAVEHDAYLADALEAEGGVAQGAPR